MIKSWMCKGGWIEYAGGNYPVKLQKYKNDVKYLQIFRGGWIESAGGNYRVKLPPQSPQCSVAGNEEEGNLNAIFISLTPTLPTPVIRSQS